MGYVQDHYIGDQKWQTCVIPDWIFSRLGKPVVLTLDYDDSPVLYAGQIGIVEGIHYSDDGGYASVMFHPYDDGIYSSISFDLLLPLDL